MNKIDIFDSVKSKAINELSPEILEIAIDSVTKSEIIKDIPIFGLAFKGYDLYKNVSESFFTEKILKFLYELNSIPFVERKAFIEKLESDEKVNNAGKKLIVILNRLDDIDKAEIIGKLFKHTILESIEFSAFQRLTHIINNAYIDDLKLLKNNKHLSYINPDVKSHLHQVGLLNQSISDIEKQRKRQIRTASSSTAIPQQIFEYNTNEYCKILMEFGF